MHEESFVRELCITSVSACFELINDTPYFADMPYDVYLNNKKVLENVKTNVFSFFDLFPKTEYLLRIGDETLSFMTKSETGCLCAREFGACGDGVTNDTIALQNAINTCQNNGRVRVEPGTYLTGPLTLKSDITLELCEGATLLGVTDESLFPVIPGQFTDPVTGNVVELSSWEGEASNCHQSFISGHFLSNINIVGRGVIDANAVNSTWWDRPKREDVARPKLVFLNRCENVLFHGVSVQNSPSWTLHPFFSKHISFLDMNIKNPKDSPNTDGADPEACDDVRFIGIRFSVGDDAIAIKSGKMALGMKYKTPANHHLVRNCLMEFAHGGVVLGSEMSGGIQNLSVSQCYFLHTDRGLRIKTRRGRGKYAVIDGVEFSNIRMDNVLTPLVVNMFYFCDPDGKTEYVWSKEKLPVDDRTPFLGKFTFRDMLCTDCEWAAGYFYGLPEMPIKEINIENVTFSMKENASEGRCAMMTDAEVCQKRGLVFHNVENVNLNNVVMEGVEGPTITREFS